VYVYFFKYMASPPLLLLLFLLYTATQPFRAAGDEIFGEFATQRKLSIREFIGTYCGFMVAHLICTGARSLLWAKASVTTADHTHHQAVAALIRCPTTFFESTYVHAVACRR
jgi:hypothetical protein